MIVVRDCETDRELDCETERGLASVSDGHQSDV